jgi:hypothetical protein
MVAPLLILKNREWMSGLPKYWPAATWRPVPVTVCNVAETVESGGGSDRQETLGGRQLS